MRSKTTLNSQRIKGLSLIEVLVTIVITSIGLMGLVSLQMQSVLATSDTGNRSHAIWVFNDIINRIHANEIASAKYIGAGPIACNAPAKVCSSYHDGSNTVNAVNCTGAELAAWDRYEVACQLRPASFFGDSAKNGFLTLSLGSGFRASPLATGTHDFFYVIKDPDLTKKPAIYIKLKPADLKKKEFNVYGKSYIDDIDTTHGWKFPLTDKVLAEALTTHGKIIFTGFKPNLSSNPGQCNNDFGTTTAYEIQVSPLKPAPGLLCNSAGVCKPAPPEPNCAATNSCPPPPCKDTGTCPVVPPLVPPIAIETKCSKANPEECSCEDSGTAILIGTSKHGEVISRCGALQKSYWMTVPR